ncbi:MAG: flagellar basal body-associated FliL family protein [Acetobacteraceae bacterium]|nr:flagellar basal body-associated FliL family protein [Acetobacteraceae bacterium]
MATAAAQQVAGSDTETGTAAPKRGRKKLLVLIAVPLLLAAIGGGLWASGLLRGVLGGSPPPAEATEGQAAAPAPAPRAPPVFLDMPDIIANLNIGNRRTAFIKLRSKLELARAEDRQAVEAAMPRLLDLFTTYLREIRPEELRGSAGTFRLREELLNRANIAVAPARVTDVLFLEILQQ